MASQIQLRRDSGANWASVNPVLAEGEIGINTTIDQFKIGNGATAWNSLEYSSANISLNDIGDVTITSVANGDFLRWNGSAWINDAVNLSTDTVGDYVTSLVQGTGVTISNNSGEGATPTIAIGQAVGTTASVSFAQVSAPVTGNLTGNADTASQLQTARTISLSGDVSGSVSFNGSGNVDIAATVQPNSVALGTDTTGNYVSGVSQGTGVTVSHTPGEGSTASIAIGQDVATNASVSFAQVTTTGDITVGGNLTVNGTTTTLNTENLVVEDNIIVLNSNVTGSPSLNAGIEIERGDSANAVLRWNESSDSWEVTEDGSTYKSIAIGQDVETSSSVTFAAVTGPLIGNASTASQLATARTISLSGDLSGSVSFSGASDVTLSASVVDSGVSLDELGDVVITSPQNNDFLKYNSASAVWVNDPINLGTDTVGNYLVDLAQGTGISISHTPGEGSTASVSLNATLDDLSNTTVGSPSSGDFLKWNGTAWVNDAIDLGTDTTGSYVTSLVQGTGVTITNNSGEGATPTIAIGQSVATNASVEFYHIAMSGPVDSSNTVATKQYVDQVAAGIDWHESVALTSAAALPNTPTYDNGTNGSGATLTAAANARLIVDGANAVTDTRILVKNQADATQNGVYDVTQQGSVSIPWALTRAEDFDGDTGHEIYGGEAVFTTGGTVNIRQGFTVTSTGSGTAGAHEFGTDNISFTQFTGTAAFVVGDGLAQNGNEISVGTASTDRIVLSAHAIDLADVTQTNTNGSDGTSFVQSHSVDSYGRITGTVTATVQDGGTTQKGIARFNSAHFSVSSGSVSIGQAVGTSSSVTFAAVTAPLIGNADTASQLQTARTISLTGDVTGSVSFNGSADVSIAATIPANSVALGTDTTGNYIATIAGTIDQVNVTGSGSETAAVTLSLPQNIATTSTPTFAGLTLSGTASVASNASVTGELTAASATVKIKSPASNQTQISINANTSSSAEIFKIINNYDIASDSMNAVFLMRDNSGMNTQSGMLFRQTASVAGVEFGPRVLIDATSSLDTPASLTENAAASVVFYVDRHTSGSVGLVIKDGASSSTNLLEWRDSTGTAYGSIGGNSASYLFTSTGASISSASISTASISTASVSGNLTVGGDLTVNGTTTTVNSTTITVDDPIITLGGDTAPGSDDNKDRGIEFRYHSGTAASVGFMGYDDSSQMFTFLVGATNTSEVFSGTAASINVGMLYIGGAQIAASNLSNGTTGSGSVALSSSPTISSASLSASTAVSGSVGFDASASVTLPAKTFFPEEYLTVSSSVTLNSTTHRYATLEMTASAGTSVITIPADASDNFPVGSVIQIIRVGAGEVQVTASAGVTANNALGSRLRAQYSTATLRKRAANTWLLSGDLKV